MRIFSPHCPNCGARVTLPAGANRATCEYCGGTLILEHHSVTHLSRTLVPKPSAKPEPPAFQQPDATLSRFDTKRFELSTLEQKIPGAPPEQFVHLELSAQRFALVYLRVVDANQTSVVYEVTDAFEALRASLEDDGDPGLSANLALETLAERGFQHRLECAVLLFDPKRMTLTAYQAGCRDSLWWVSTEEGRCVDPSHAHDLLERKMLREARDHFSNSAPVRFAAGDLFVLVSAGYAGRGGGGYGNGTRALLDALSAHLGEDPLRVVALAKNAFWESRSSSERAEAPSGDITIAAVRAQLPELMEKLAAPVTIEVLRTKKYSIAAARRAGESLELLPLHSDRHVAIWLSSVEGALAPEAAAKARAAVLSVLDGQTGDNDNARAAGRKAFEAMGTDASRVRMAVIQIFDAFERVKYYRAGWKQPLAVGPRGFRDSDSIQAFDEGGEATVGPGARLFFPGSLPYEGEAIRGSDLAERWSGGKASLLYEALREHWKTKKPEKALEKLLRAATSDVLGLSPSGVALVTNDGG